jgi:hypothetical protein
MDWVALARRAMAVLFRPTAAWDAAAAETTSAREVLLGYVAPLAAIPAVCGAIGGTLFGFSFADVGLRPRPLVVILEAAAGFVLTMAGVWLAGQALARLAGLFGGKVDPLQGLRLVAYSGTAVWLAGLFYLLPGLQIPAVLLGVLWSFFLLYRGLPALLDVPEDRLLTCFAASLITVGMIAILRGFLVAKAAELGGPLSLA